MQSKLYHLFLLNRLDRHSDALALAKELLNQISSDTLVECKLNIMLIQFLSNRSIGNYAECKKIINTIKTLKGVGNLEEYGFFLRNREIMLTSDEAIVCLKEALSFFKNKNSHEECARVKLTLAMHLAFTEKLDEAEALILEAREVLSVNRLERHIVLNNLATVKIFKGEKNIQTLELLQHALTTAYVTFDKTTILANMLGIYVELGRYEEAEEVIVDIMALCENQKDLALLQLVYFNICFFFQKTGDMVSLDKYKRKLLLCADEVKDNWRYRLKGKQPKERMADYLREYESHADFIVYWHFRVSRLSH